MCKDVSINRAGPKLAIEDGECRRVKLELTSVL